MDADKGVFTVEEAASYLRVSRQTIWRLIRAASTGGRVRRVESLVRRRMMFAPLLDLAVYTPSIDSCSTPNTWQAMRRAVAALDEEIGGERLYDALALLRAAHQEVRKYHGETGVPVFTWQHVAIDEDDSVWGTVTVHCPHAPGSPKSVHVIVQQEPQEVDGALTRAWLSALVP
jgi:excisionase family DNA binding protein